MTRVLGRRAGSIAFAAGAAAVLVAPLSADGAAPASSSVTIRAEGLDLSGTVASPRAACESNRTVVVFKVVGSKGGGDDLRFASDTTEARGGVGVWSTGNTGTPGRFYAKVRKTSRCSADTSRVVRASTIS